MIERERLCERKTDRQRKRERGRERERARERERERESSYRFYWFMIICNVLFFSWYCIAKKTKIISHGFFTTMPKHCY